ncbi:GTP-binding protein TypA/BipA [Mobiluncus mulieris]|nr:GTP-binding protein TypA/BipA [Mobiluncus mulieris]
MCQTATWNACSRRFLKHIPGPTYIPGAPLQAHVTNLDASPFLGRLALLRIHNGSLRQGQTVGWRGRTEW